MGLRSERVDDIPLLVGQVRLDSTTASGHHGVTVDGLFQFGHSKDHRPDLPQVKVMLSTLDPLGLPVAMKVQERPLRRYRDRPAGRAVARTLSVSVAVNDLAVAQAKRRLGWRVYATNAPATVGLAQAILAYRDAHLIEGGFGRLKGQPLSLTPLFLHRDDHVTGLIHLLSIGLRLLTLVQHVVRQQLAAQARTLAGLSPGNLTRSTARPTTEALLAAFRSHPHHRHFSRRTPAPPLAPLPPSKPRSSPCLDALPISTPGSRPLLVNHLRE